MMTWLFLLLAAFNSSEKKIEIQILPESTFRLKASSNVNKFTCDLNGCLDYQCMTLFYTQSGNEVVFSNAALKIDVDDFDCHNRRLTSDMKETLQRDDFPNITIQLLNIDPAEEHAHVMITLTDVTRAYTFDYKLTKTIEGLYQLNATVPLQMSQFDIVPPKPFLGLIEVDDDIIIELSLLLQVNG